MRVYTDLADWWPLFSPPSHYVEEAEDLLATLLTVPDAPPVTLLELGAGGGSLAYHFKEHFALTLSDISARMLANSQRLNPQCEHVVGDMRTIDLGRTFDLVFIHDAIVYAIDEKSVRATLATAARHCRLGGGIVVVPDHVRETFEPDTDHGGEDGADGRGLRYLSWSWDADPDDTTYEVAYAFLLREADGSVRVEGDRHVEGLFAREDWLAWLRDAGFDPASRRDPWRRYVFSGRKIAP
jgi:SAM-dependent methyltransferase